MRKFRITMTEEQLRLMSAAVEDWHRFLSGECYMRNATSYVDDFRKARETLQNQVRPFIVPKLPHPNSAYDWAGSNCPNEHQRRAIAMSYLLYREPLHFLTVNAERKMGLNVYNSDTLTCPEQGPMITIEEVIK